MRLLIQRVKKASVSIHGQVKSTIGNTFAENNAHNGLKQSLHFFKAHIQAPLVLCSVSKKTCFYLFS